MLIFSSIIVWLFGEDQTYSRSDDLVLIHVIIFSLQPSFDFQLLLLYPYHLKYNITSHPERYLLYTYFDVIYNCVDGLGHILRDTNQG